MKARVRKPPAGVAPTDFDVVIAGDMSRWGERSLRIAQEARSYAAQGLRVGLLHASPCNDRSRIAPEIQTCVRRGLATVVSTTSLHIADLLVAHAPSEIDWSGEPLSSVRARRTTFVCHQLADTAVTRTPRRLRAEATQWVATNAWVRDAAPAKLRLEAKDWRPMIEGIPVKRRPSTSRSKARIGWISRPGHAQPQCSDAVEIVTLDEELLSQLSLDRLALLDGLAYFPTSESEELLDTVVLAAAGMGLPVAAAPWLRPHYKGAAMYCAPENAVSRLTSKSSRKRFATAVPQHDRPARSGDSQRPVMFVASNGVGVGHVSRLLAIARRMDARTPIVFATQAQALPAIEGLGYLAEYIPSASYVGGDFASWDNWFQHDLETLADIYDPALVVYDGNNPSHGLVRAVTPRRDCGLAWIRRGMWGALTSPFIDNSRWFDLIIEPGELDGQIDDGITARRRDEALLVPPIRLLDDDELLPRADAARRLGLDPGRPSVLIQLGAGYNRDVVALVDTLIGQLQQFDKLQICVAEWLNGTQPLNYWKGVFYLRGYPLSQYFKAFDFSISAAGYNTFHEIVRFGLPTIFIPNRHPSMDDQAGRSSYAQASQAAFELDESDLGDLPDLVGLLMDGKAREFLVANSVPLHQPNGAAEAARLLTELHRAAQ